MDVESEEFRINGPLLGNDIHITISTSSALYRYMYSTFPTFKKNHFLL